MVNWSVNPSGIGTMSWSGDDIVYTAPATITSPQTVTVTATSLADNITTASAQISLVPSVAVSAAPATVTLYASQTQQFTASVNYTSGVSVTWSLSPNVGTIDGTGLYTAPSTIPYQQTITVTASTSAGYAATASVTLVPLVSASITAPSGLTATAASVSEIDLTWNASSENGGAVAGYSIFRNGAPVGTTTTTSYADLGLVLSTSYTYTVATYDAQGNISAPSANVSATTLSNPPAPGLVASLDLNEGAGTVAHDSSGNGNNGVITGATWSTSGRLTNALQFNGSGWVTVPDSSSLDLTAGLTLEAWVNAATLGDWQAVIVKEQSQDLCYGLFADNAWPAANLFIGAEQVIYGNQNVPFNVWTHLAVTYDGANENLYLNGALVGSNPLTGAIATSSQPLRIGGDSVWGQYFNGMIEEVRIYNRALAQAEIQSDMQAVSVSVSPASATLYASQTQQFTATVTNTSNTAVRWFVSPSVGSIDATGLYMAPATIVSQQAVTVTATSQYDYKTTGTAVIALEPQILTSISVPQGLTATAVSCLQINLSWTASTEPGGAIAGYYIFRNGVLAGTTSTTSYSDLGLVFSTSYTYTVAAYDAQGYLSAQSSGVSATTLASTQAPGLVAYYSFSEGAGTSLYDSSCNGNNGVITNATWSTSGTAGGALVFNGSSWVEVPDSNSLDLTTGMTLEAWVNPASLSSNNDIINKGSWGGSGYALLANSWVSNTPAGFGFIGDAEQDIGVFGPSGLSPNTWSHLATTYDGTTLKLFVNGVQVNSQTQVGPAALISTLGPLRIGSAPLSGGFYSGPGGYFNGMIDEVRIYSRALSQVEIQNDMLLPAANITISPASVQLSALGTQQFTSDMAATWSLSAAVGTIDATGLYTAPAIVASVQTITVTATSQTNSTASTAMASATITLVPSISASLPVPQGLTAIAVSPSEVDLTWNAADPASSVVGYLIFRDGALAGTSTAPAYADLAVACIGSYTYTIAAYDAQGNNSNPSASVSANVSASSGTPVPGLVAYYNFNEGQGTVVHDCSGNGNDGTINAASWSSSGKWGSGLALSSDNVVTVPDSNSLELTTGMTLEAWVNPTQLAGTLYVISKGDYVMTVGGMELIGVNGEASMIGAGNIPVNTWTHLARTYDGANVNFFVNGALSSGFFAGVGTIQQSSDPLYIGFGGSGAFPAGVIDEVRIYNRALSQAEIQSDMQNAMNVFVGPLSVTVYPSQTQQFTAAVTKTSNKAVAWSLSPNVGTMDPSGLYTAPAAITAQQTVTVTATCQADTSKTATAQITLLPDVTVSVNPAVATLNPWGTQQFNATVTNSANTAVTWSLSPNVGTIYANPFYATYTAPGSIATQQTVTLTATSQAETSKSATAQITLLPAIAVSVSPASSIVYASQTLQFSATVVNTPNTTVTWNVYPNVGTINASGLYTAPATISTPQVITVTAISQADWTTTGTATITLMPPESGSISVPGGLTATTVSASEIDLSWTASAEAGASVAGYNILRNGVPVGASTTTSYSDLGLVASTTYTYTIAAYDAQGNSSALSGSASATTNSATPNLVAYYNFNEGAGTIANDSSGNGNNGVITSATWTSSGEQGSALVFNGSNSWVEVPDSITLDLTTGMTLEAWVNLTPSSSVDDWVGVIVKEQDQEVCYGLFSTSDGDWPAGDVFIGGEQLLYGPSQLPMSTWTHLATTYDGTVQNLYVNGVLVASNPQTGPIVTAPQPLHIGGDSVWGDYFTGMIDEVRIYNRALSQSEIERDMLQGVTITVAPTSATLSPLQTQQFSAMVTGSANVLLAWSVALGLDAPAGAQAGSINAAGLYTAPSSIPVQYTVVVTAQSQIDPAKSASATITLLPPASAAAPTFSPLGGSYTTAQTVTLSTATSGATIRYTTDGTTPSNTVGTIYTGPITVTGPTTIKAIAYASGLANSKVAVSKYTIRAVAPAFSPGRGTYTTAQTVTLSTATSGASINYTTDGSKPSDTAGTLYTGPITVTGTTTIKAVAYASGLTNSTVSTATYKIRVLPPTFSPTGGTYTTAQTVTLSTATAGASINYTTDGSTPSNTAGTPYTGPITVAGTTTVKAVAFMSGLTNSTVSTAKYTIRAVAPTFSPSGGTYTASQTVTLSTTTAGASINYTTDGSTPSNTAGTLYTGPITVAGTTTVKAIAYASGLTNSTVSTATYTIRAIGPIFSPAAGTYTTAQTVTLSTTTSGASINYTTDGSTPSNTAGTLYTGPITVATTTTIKAVAYATGLTNSTISTASYTIRVLPPSFSPAAGTYTTAQMVTLSTATAGASINYTTDGSTPSNTAGTLYTGPITVATTTTIKAVAYATGLTNSTISTASYTIRVLPPSFSPAAGTYTTAQMVTLSTATAGASINYTTDGSTPSNTAGTLYTGPITVSATTTIKAVAYMIGLANSTVSTATYTIKVLPPTFSPLGGTYTTPQTVTLSTATSGASINYTTDGSTPSNTAGTLYTGPITVSATTTIKALAYMSGLTNSTVSTATYTIR